MREAAKIFPGLQSLMAEANKSISPISTIGLFMHYITNHSYVRVGSSYVLIRVGSGYVLIRVWSGCVLIRVGSGYIIICID